MERIHHIFGFAMGIMIGFLVVIHVSYTRWQPRRVVKISEQVQDVLDRRKYDQLGKGPELSAQDHKILNTWILKRNVVEGLVYVGILLILLGLAYVMRRTVWGSFYLGTSIWAWFATLGRFFDLYGFGGFLGNILPGHVFFGFLISCALLVCALAVLLLLLWYLRIRPSFGSLELRERLFLYLKIITRILIWVFVVFFACLFGVKILLSLDLTYSIIWLVPSVIMCIVLTWILLVKKGK